LTTPRAYKSLRTFAHVILPYKCNSNSSTSNNLYNAHCIPDLYTFYSQTMFFSYSWTLVIRDVPDFGSVDNPVTFCQIQQFSESRIRQWKSSKNARKQAIKTVAKIRTSSSHSSKIFSITKLYTYLMQSHIDMLHREHSVGANAHQNEFSAHID